MTCPDCNGDNKQCFRCDGLGELCDVCGEASEVSPCDDCALDVSHKAECDAVRHNEEGGDE